MKTIKTAALLAKEAKWSEDKMERCIMDVKKQNKKDGRPAKGDEDGKGNPWAICRSQENKSEKKKDKK